MPRRGERALGRARVLAQNGHLRDALTTLEQVTITDEEKVDADRLRSDIQRQLMALEQASGEMSRPRRCPRRRVPLHEVSEMRIPRLRTGRALPQLRVRLSRSRQLA